MKHGRRLGYLVVAGVLFVLAIGVLAARDVAPTGLVLGVVVAALGAIVALFGLARWRKR